MENTIWRMIVGDAEGRDCPFEMDMEIVQVETPNTRRKMQMMIDRVFYSLVLVFTSTFCSDIKFLKLKPEDIENLEALCVTFGDNNNHVRMGRFTLKRVSGKTYFVLHAQYRDLVTMLPPETVERIIGGIRVKGYLDRHGRLQMGLRNVVQAHDLSMCCYHFTLKYMVDYLDCGKEVFPRRQTQHEFRLAFINCYSNDFLRVFKENFPQLMALVQETVGHDWTMNARLNEPHMDLTVHSWNPYNEHMREWSEGQLLVAGVWNLHMP